MKRIFSIVMIALLLINTVPNDSYAEVYNYQASVTIERTFSADEVILDNVTNSNNDVEVTYTITADSIPKSAIPVVTPKKEVVLIMDVSGSMGWKVDNNVSGSPSRISVAKTAAETFVNELSKNSDIKLSVITYSSNANYLSNYSGLYDISHGDVKNNSDAAKNTDGIIAEIRKIDDGGGTNIGDAIRRGYQTLDAGESTSDKYFVFLTDGEPTKYSRKSSSDDTFYTGLNGAPSTDTDNPKALLYAKNMMPHLTDYKKSYFVAFSKSGANKLADIADEIRSYYKVALTPDDINDIYQDVSTQITADLGLESSTLLDTLPDGISIVSKPSEMEVDGQNITMDIGQISYTLNEAGTHYVAVPKEIKMTVRANKPGDYIFGSNYKKLEYKDIDGVNKEKAIDGQSLKYFREPMKNFTFTRENHASGNLDNAVKLSWDVYPGAVKYQVYKNDGVNDVLINTITDPSVRQLDLPIAETDKSTTTYRIEAVLNDNELTQKVSTTGDTNPSILNLSAKRENNSFIVTWDIVEGADKYLVTPIINGGAIAQDSNQSNFKNVGGQVRYEYELIDPDSFVSYSDVIKFKVDAEKTDATVYDATSNELQIKQVISTFIEPFLDDFYYAKNKTVKVVVKSDMPFPTGVDIYDPMIVVDLKLPTETNSTPLEFTYSTVKAYEAIESYDSVSKIYSYANADVESVTVARTGTGSVRLYVTLNEYSQKALIAGSDFNLYVDFGIVFESTNGVLKNSIIQAIHATSQFSDLKIYDIKYNIRSLLDYFYTEEIDELVSMEATVYYNTSVKVISDPFTRDEEIGVSNQSIKFKKETILNEF